MKDELRDPRSVRAAAHQAEAVRKPVKYAVLAGVVALGCAVGFQWWKSRHPLLPPGVETAIQDDRQATPAAAQPEEVVEVREVSSAEAAAAPAAPTATKTMARSAPAQTQTTRPEPTPYTRQLVTSLTQLDLSRGPFSAEQADQWKQGFQQLIQQGSTAVPAIREFLEQNRDLNFGGGSSLGYSSLRSAFFDALQQIGGPEALALMSETLKTTSVPSEIARLARYLEQQAPGQYRDQIGTAVRETLAQAAAGQLRGWDVGPLFQVLQSYGDSSVAVDLEKSASKWSYYSALALANLPSGEGIPALIRLAQDAPRSSSLGVALEVLAQVAVQYSDASAALVELARSGTISERHWIVAAAALGGERYFIRDTGSDNAAVPIGSGAKSYHLEASNQNFYSTPAGGGMSNEQINQRVTIIDQLLAVSPSAAVAEALQNTRALLLAKGQQASAN
jgi:hypothetical protein